MKSALKYIHKNTQSMLRLGILMLLCSLVTSCRKYLEVGTPSKNISNENVYKDNTTAAAVLTGVYTQISQEYLTSGINGLSFAPGLSADEFTLYKGNGNLEFGLFYTNKLNSGTNIGFWNSFYRTIFTANSAIEGLQASTVLNPLVKQRLLGEARFIRAFCYFYLVNLYGDVPLILNTDYTLNSVASRIPKREVYEQIILDLKEASGLLADQYMDAGLLNPTQERLRPNRWVTAALLARVYLYTEQWSLAEQLSSTLIENGQFELVQDLDEVFLSGSKEAIWQLQGVDREWNTRNAMRFIIQAHGPDEVNPVYLSDGLLSAFKLGDDRLNKWVGKVEVGNDQYYFPYKYKSAVVNAPLTEYDVVFRLSEQYLIRAEARIRLGRVSEGIADLNLVRDRARTKEPGQILDPLPALSLQLGTPGALRAVLQERRIELFSEWGHRWLDLKRTGTIDEVMPDIAEDKGGTWVSNAQYYPIPLQEIRRNPNLKQNNGY